jgi:hypothetical protein
MQPTKTYGSSKDLPFNAPLQVMLDKHDELSDLIKDLTAQRDGIRRSLIQIAGDDEAVTMDGELVFAYPYTAKFREAALRKNLPDLTDRFVRTVEVEQFDMQAFAKAFPAEAREYQSRTWTR